MNTKLRSIRNITGIALVLIAALMLSACGGSDESASGNSAETATPAPTPTPEPTPEPTVIPIPEVAVTTLEVPEPGSDNEKILAVFETQVRAMNTRDYESFTRTCPPGNWENKQSTWNKLAGFWDGGGILGAALPGFTYDSFNARSIAFKSYDDGTVQTLFAVYSYDTLLTEEWGWWWKEINGEWYSTSVVCAGPNNPFN
jgi:hypothetical protein